MCSIRMHTHTTVFCTHTAASRSHLQELLFKWAFELNERSQLEATQSISRGTLPLEAACASNHHSPSASAASTGSLFVRCIQDAAQFVSVEDVVANALSLTIGGDGLRSEALVCFNVASQGEL
jgi:hypothetical protein